jgi:hypothetical protein
MASVGLIVVDDDFRRDRRFRHQAIPLVIAGRACVSLCQESRHDPFSAAPARDAGIVGAEGAGKFRRERSAGGKNARLTKKLTAWGGEGT